MTNKTAIEIDKIVDEKLEIVELTGEDRLMLFELSCGMRKRVGLARALVIEPELILFDEPTQGLGSRNRRTDRRIDHQSH